MFTIFHFQYSIVGLSLALQKEFAHAVKTAVQ